MSEFLPVFSDADMAWSEPDVVQTSRGLWPAAGLTRSVTFFEDENEWSSAVEYRLGEIIVHRSARTHVKAPAPIGGEAATF